MSSTTTPKAQRRRSRVSIRNRFNDDDDNNVSFTPLRSTSRFSRANPEPMTPTLPLSKLPFPSAANTNSTIPIRAVPLISVPITTKPIQQQQEQQESQSLQKQDNNQTENNNDGKEKKNRKKHKITRHYEAGPIEGLVTTFIQLPNGKKRFKRRDLLKQALQQNHWNEVYTPKCFHVIATILLAAFTIWIAYSIAFTLPVPQISPRM